MVAGRGITHSERPPAERVGKLGSGYGIQTWVALPESEEDAPPRFEHHPREALPVIEGEGLKVRLILGKAYGAVAPASVFSETFYGDALLQPGARLPMPDDHEDRGLHILEGSISVAGQTFEAGQMMVFRPKDSISVAAGPTGARLIILGGATLGGPRYLWWNFVSSRQEKIDTAKEAWRKADWGRGQFDLPPTIARNSFRCRSPSPGGECALFGRGDFAPPSETMTPSAFPPRLTCAEPHARSTKAPPSGKLPRRAVRPRPAVLLAQEAGGLVRLGRLRSAGATRCPRATGISRARFLRRSSSPWARSG